MEELRKFKENYEIAIRMGADFVTPERIIQLIEALLRDLDK